VRGPLLAESSALTRTLQAEPDLSSELLPGRFSSWGHVVDCHVVGARR
jgi:hypothetical protein